jgi:hypothetical protein
MTRLTRRTFLTRVSLGALLAGAPLPVWADEAFPGKYLIVCRATALGLDVRGAGREFAVVQTAGIDPQTNRVWILRKSEHGFTIASDSNQLLLDVRGAGGDGAILQLGGLAKQPNREFVLERTADGFYVISAFHSGLSLDTKGAGRWMTEVMTAGHGGQANREWLLLPADLAGLAESQLPQLQFLRGLICNYLAEPAVKLATFDRRLIVLLPKPFIERKISELVAQKVPGCAVKNVSLNGGEVQTLVQHNDTKATAELGVFAQSWPKKELSVEVRLVRGSVPGIAGLFIDLNAYVPMIKSLINEPLRAQPFWKLVDLIGVQSEWVVAVLTPGSDNPVSLMQLLR